MGTAFKQNFFQFLPHRNYSILVVNKSNFELFEVFILGSPEPKKLVLENVRQFMSMGIFSGTLDLF